MWTTSNIEMIASLKEKIDEWLDEDDHHHPHFGDNISILMAHAALSVLFAVQDAEDSLAEDGLLKQEN